TEGIPDALRCLEAGHPAVACSGLDLTERQRDKLLSLNRPIILGFDNDPPGKNAARSLTEVLYRQEVSGLRIPDGVKDLAEMPTLEANKIINYHINLLGIS